MYGLLLRALQDYVLTTFDPASWERIRVAGGFLPQGFEPLLHYNHEVLRVALRQASNALERPVPTILEDLGTWVIAAGYDGAPRRLLRFGGADFTDFLFSLDELRDRARLALPDLIMPELRIAELAEGVFRLSCPDGLPELGWIFLGALRAMADDYGALVVIEEEEGPDSRGIALTIRLLEPQFSAGRRFELSRQERDAEDRAGEDGETEDAGTDGQPVALDLTASPRILIRPRKPDPVASPCPSGGVLLDPADFTRLLPLHLIVSESGVIEAAGPLLQRMFPGEKLVGSALFSRFRLRGQGAKLARLPLQGGRRLRLEPLGGGLRLRGSAFTLGAGRGVLLVFSFGIDIVRAVETLKLTDADFAVTDLTMELLCMVEANTLAMREMRALSRRLEGARRQAEDEALTDPLTGLRNRRASDSFLARLCQDGSPFTLIHMDLDFFKAVNDQHGHAAGDEVLMAVAAILLRLTRSRDCIARIGGDEFIAILPGLEPSARLDHLAAQMIAAIARPVPWHDRICRVSASIGMVTVGRGVEPHPEAVLAQADRSLYAAKAAGRGRVVRTGFPEEGAEPRPPGAELQVEPPVLRIGGGGR